LIDDIERYTAQLEERENARSIEKMKRKRRGGRKKRRVERERESRLL